MHRPAVRPILLALAASLAFTACHGPEEATPVPTTATDVPTGGSPPNSTAPAAPSAPPPEIGELHDAPPETTRVLPEGATTLTSDEGHTFTLVEAYRLADDRVVVTGLLGLDPAVGSDFVINGFEEPAMRRASASGAEFAPFELRAEDDGATYLPVRDADERCLCSVMRSGFQDESEAMAVMTVMSAPPDVTSVDLLVHGFGEVEDVALTQLPARTTVPWGGAETLTVRSLERENGVVALRVTVASPAGATGWGYGVYGRTSEQLCLAGIAVVGSGQQAGLVEGCVRGVLPPAGQAVDLEVTAPDPGTDTLVVLPSNGAPIVVQPSGEASPGGGEQLVTYESRTRTEGATVARGEQVEVVLDTSVLFGDNESELTPQAQQTLAVAIDALRGQDGRSITVAGHTDGQGGAEHNAALSLARAHAVRDALAAALDEAWTFEVFGHGSDRPVADEAGTAEEVAVAQARNRRVELTVGP